ncbi:putative tyrosyl-dna phosphodiesterase domain protein [Golovinomyces cichoracearum]|uniref:Putative tyrosyl-dna phosphodiesterase domain protein n=1 Tax=Golovinomyces cichoracearum TaxID=62708 RepID=A0A420IXN4_9PEZI|nr:putative tyrosyl-dna phosphodiesterase domain protein [Golovinomyces cichoracearum]
MLGLSSLDRKAMEQSRLARIAQKRKEQTTEENDPKRKRRPDTFPLGDNRSPNKKSKLEPLHSDHSSGTVSKLSLVTPHQETKPLVFTGSDKVIKGISYSPHCSFQTVLTKGVPSGVQYPNGVVKKTSVRGFPRRGDDISIEEVLQKNDLTLAVLGAFQIDPEWIMGKLEPQTRVYWVLQAKTESEVSHRIFCLLLNPNRKSKLGKEEPNSTSPLSLTKKDIESQATSNYKFCFPSMKGRVNCMHSKLQLLAHPSHLRIVVPTANLTSYDWGETGVMENMCFIIDLPRHENAQSSSLEDLTQFAQELIYFLGAQGLPEQVIKSVLNFDFSRTAKIGFVHSMYDPPPKTNFKSVSSLISISGGAHTGNSWKRTGYCGLASTVQKLGIQNKDPIKIDFVTASLGNLTPKFIESLYLAAQGSIAELTPKKSRGGKSSEIENELRQNVTRLCRVYFPTRETVEKSIGGVRVNIHVTLPLGPFVLIRDGGHQTTSFKAFSGIAIARGREC